MELRKIRALAALMNEQGLTCVTLKEGEDQVELRRECSAPAAGALPAESREKSGEAPAPAGQAVPSPMVGVVYLAPEPGAAPFVSVGSRVKPGDVLCIIEAMKLMNEITAEQEGTILERCVENGQVVEYGQPLFRIG